MLRADLREQKRARTRRRRRRVLAALACATAGVVAVGGLTAAWALPELRGTVASAMAPPDDPPPVATQSLRVAGEVEHQPAETVLVPIDPDADPPFDGFLTTLGPSIDVYDIDDPASITVVVNKQRPLDPIDWAPSDLVAPRGIPNPNGQPLRSEAAEALEAMYAEARADGIGLRMSSGYRSHRLQQNTFADRVSTLGAAAAELRSARPGHSEHQTGLAVDLDDGNGCELRTCFGDTAGGRWLRENAHRFGFILRYDDGEDGTVGYEYEPWHFRYVGVDVATDMHDHGINTLEAYFGLPDAPDY